MERAYTNVVRQSVRLPAHFVKQKVRDSLLNSRRCFSCGRCLRQNSHGSRPRLKDALRSTKIQWKPIPVALGIAFLGGFQLYRTQVRDEKSANENQEDQGKPRKRERIKPSGPWQIQIMSTLPLKALSRIWGKFNELTIPYYLRVPGFRLYSFIFGVNLDEVAEPDLHVYPNLASFFYRTLKPGVRPLNTNPNAVLSPADGKIIQFGVIRDGQVEQVKGVTYSLDALLGDSTSIETNQAMSNIPDTIGSPRSSKNRTALGEEEHISADEEFARVNGISYSLPNLLSGSQDQSSPHQAADQSVPSRPSSEAEVRADFAQSQSSGGSDSWWTPFDAPKSSSTLYYCVVYLAPGDYHRFHSPVSWVVSSRRHFAGELYSVSPYLQRTLPGLFTLNERVALLGRWRWGFFSFTPVGATNVGSIKINFDRELRTNSLTTDTAADRAAEEAKERGEAYCGYAEATYAEASKILGGHALKRGEEMGGFQLGSTIVLVFEAPKSSEGEAGQEKMSGFEWNVEKGQKVKYGQALGRVIANEAS